MEWGAKLNEQTSNCNATKKETQLERMEEPAGLHHAPERVCMIVLAQAHTTQLLQTIIAQHAHTHTHTHSRPTGSPLALITRPMCNTSQSTPAATGNRHWVSYERIWGRRPVPHSRVASKTTGNRTEGLRTCTERGAQHGK